MGSWLDTNGTVDYYLMIAGIGVFGTSDTVPTGSWFTGSFSSAHYHPWLHWTLNDISEEISFEEGSLRVDGITAEISNPSGALLSMLHPSSQLHTYGTQSMTSSATLGFFVETNHGFDATSGVVYVGQERISYLATGGSTAFVSLTRGTLGTLPEPHFFNSYDMPPSTFKVQNYPGTLKGRRAILYARSTDGTETAIYRGFVGGGTRWGRGFASVPIEHISSFIERKIGSGLRKFHVNPQKVFVSGSSNSKTTITEDGTGGYVSSSVSATNITNWSNNISAEISNVLSFRGSGDKLKIVGRDNVETRLEMIVNYGTFMYAYGWNDGLYSWPTGKKPEQLADRVQMPFYVDLSYDNPSIYIAPSDASQMIAGDWISITGNASVMVSGVSGGDVTLSTASIDYEANGGDTFLSVEDAKDPIYARQVFRFDDTLADAIRRSTGQLSGQTEPLYWCARGVSLADLDLGELSTAAQSVPPSMRKISYEIIEPTKLEDVVTPQFALCGIAPRVVSDGKIGFARIHQPVASESSEILVDDTVWSLVEAAEAESREDSTALLTGARIQYGKSHVPKESKNKGNEWQGKLNLIWREGFDQLGDSRTIGFDVPGLRRNPSRSPADFDQEINSQVVATHFAMFGLPSSVVDIPCTWAAKSIYCGDVVTLTHPVVPDVNGGSIGTESKLGIVVGRRLKLCANGPDILTILIPDSSGGAGIAPSAKGTAYDSGSHVITCSDAYASVYEAGGDLTTFSSFYSDGDFNVRLIEIDSETPSTWNATVVSVDVGTGKVELSSDVFSTAFPASGIWITLADWDSTTSRGQSYAFQADSATAPSLGSTADSPKKWVV